MVAEVGVRLYRDLWELVLAEPKFRLYSSVKCVSGRPELAAIAGCLVGVICRRELSDGWLYTVAPDRKTSATFTCTESELQAPELKSDIADTRSYAIVRDMLRYYLDQDFDCRYESVADALCAAVENTDCAKLLAALSELEAESDEVVKEVLDDCDVDLWDDTTPRELLLTIKTLAKLS